MADPRAQRLARGHQAEARERAQRPPRRQMMLPLLMELQRAGGEARPIELYDRVAERMGLEAATRGETDVLASGRPVNVFERGIRWARQTLVARGAIDDGVRGVWRITKAGERKLGLARPGMVITFFETAAGAALWTHAEDALAVLEPGSVDLILTSPPYPLNTDRRAYGTTDTAGWLAWMMALAREWLPVLKPSGSLVLDLGPVGYEGRPVQSPYIERLTLGLVDEIGFRLADRLYWENPSRMATPMPWVAIRRVRLKPSVQPLLWFSRGDAPFADNRAVLTPYLEAHRWLGSYKGKIRRPSSETLSATSFATDHGGAIPGNIIRAGTVSGGGYRAACRAAGVDQHPAAWPDAIPDFLIRFLTRAGDLVYDPFFGSGSTGAVAEKLGRRWIGSERSKTFLESARLRFPATTWSMPA